MKIETFCAKWSNSDKIKIRPLFASTALSEDTEKDLVMWITELRRDGIPVSAMMLKLKALDLAQENGVDMETFTASWGWRRSFLNQHKMSFRTKTNKYLLNG